MNSAHICVIGNFNGDRESFDGQTVKTKTVFKALCHKYGTVNVIKSDTYYVTKRPFFFFYHFFKNIKRVDNVIILPAHRSIKILMPLVVILKKARQKIHYIMIGGWLPSLIDKNKRLVKYLHKIDYIYPETQKVANLLIERGITQVVTLKNCKDLKTISKNNDSSNKYFKMCIFCRIEKQKGINEAIEIINKLNSNYGNEYFLDIYGSITNEYKNEFYELIAKSNNVKYCGVKKPQDSVKTISNYDLLLFPTKYYTEGIPGTIIDSYFAGVPVLASKWESFNEVIIDNRTGIGYDFNNQDDFYRKLEYIITNKKILANMKKECLKISHTYLPNEVLKPLFKNID